MTGQVQVLDVLNFIDHAMEGMITTLESLGDDLVNRRPNLPGANSAYAIGTHCCGVMEYWGGQVLAARDIERDRDAEFVATGEVQDLAVRMREHGAQLSRDLRGFDGAAPPNGPIRERDKGRYPTQGAVLMHIYEELAQHRGHLDLTADLVGER
ncbi:DUF664 domain-containing protein [Leekyejoonella antrihumi]|uniref:DUF664 domain-containing protein n=1 Tax=Leekyejoonella antrihumi TaxID=1660198 RepID=A0A563E1Z3_9MICO|nr:DUF664 domain-containing protein [Leekyejoonella antrihumi]TWP36557.1 DUF664 domain-containing protein [Leekyejoonella antrihumi]